MLLSLFLLFFCLSYFLKFWIYTLYFYVYVFILPFICLFIYVLIFWKSSMIVIFRHMCIWRSLDMKILLKLLKSQFRIKSIKKATAKMWVLKFVHFMQPNKWDDIKNYQRVGCFHYLNSNLFLFFYLRIVFWEIHESSKTWSMLLLKTPQKYKAHKVSHWAYSRFFRSLRISLGSVTADLVTFTEEILNSKLHFLYSESVSLSPRLP